MVGDSATLGTRGTAWTPETRLYSDGIVAGTDGPVAVPPASTFQRAPGTPYLASSSGQLAGAVTADEQSIASARAHLDAAWLPGRDSPYADMARHALIDIETLMYPNGASVAAASPHWRYVWPRDTGFTAAALSVVGRHEHARRALAYLAQMQERDGTWQARYLPDGSGRVPDDRGPQHDGLGWTLWATWLDWQLSRTIPPPDIQRMVRAAVTASLGLLDPGSCLPQPSQDYWELDIDEVTLGVAGPVLLALRTGADLLDRFEESTLAGRARTGADQLHAAITRTFGAYDYARRSSGRGGRDASIAFLLPPFAPSRPDIAQAWRWTVDATSTPNGGVRPGEEWDDRQTAWTPQVSLHALTAAYLNDTALAHRLLSWLDLRRTRLGALPEKVTAAGRPAAVAPLGLTAATVLLALAALDGRRLPVPGSPSGKSPNHPDAAEPSGEHEGATR